MWATKTELPIKKQYEKYLAHVVKNSKKILKKCGLAPDTKFVFIQMYTGQDRIVTHSDSVVELFSDRMYNTQFNHVLICVLSHNEFYYQDYYARIKSVLDRFGEGLLLK